MPVLAYPSPEINGNASWGITGNANLVPEQNNSLSIGLKFSRDKTADYLRVVGFNEPLKNEIVYVSSGSTYANETSTSRRRGFEIDGSVTLGSAVMSGTYTYLIAKNNDGTIEIDAPSQRNRIDKLCADYMFPISRCPLGTPR